MPPLSLHFSSCVRHVLSALLTNLHDQSVHVMGPIYKQFSDTQCIHVLLCIDIVCGAFTSLLQARVTFCRWLIKENRVFWLEPVALGSRVGAQTTGYFNWSWVSPQNRVFCRSRLWESGLGSGTDACGYPILWKSGTAVPNRGTAVPNRGTGGTAQA